MTLAGELMFGNEPPKSPDALDRKPLARTAQEFRGTRPVIVIASGQRECVPDDERNCARAGMTGSAKQSVFH
jgi:hypothetical protein